MSNPLFESVKVKGSWKIDEENVFPDFNNGVRVRDKRTVNSGVREL